MSLDLPCDAGGIVNSAVQQEMKTSSHPVLELNYLWVIDNRLPSLVSDFSFYDFSRRLFILTSDSAPGPPKKELYSFTLSETNAASVVLAY